MSGARRRRGDEGQLEKRKRGGEKGGPRLTELHLEGQVFKNSRVDRCMRPIWLRERSFEGSGRGRASERGKGGRSEGRRR